VSEYEDHARVPDEGGVHVLIFKIEYNHGLSARHATRHILLVTHSVHLRRKVVSQRIMRKFMFNLIMIEGGN
jgi:hypothetical protein